MWVSVRVAAVTGGGGGRGRALDPTYSGTRFASGGKAPSVHDEFAKWQSVWKGVTEPRQNIEGVTTKTITYRDLMKRYY